MSVNEKKTQTEYLYPRLVLTAPKSGSGKTMLTCGLIRALMNRNLKVMSFKCGPDYIDPMFHRKVLGVQGGNLDTYFSEEEDLISIFEEGAKDKDITIIEGVMGYYDGLGGVSEDASTYDVAKALNAPAILVVDAKGASVSLAATIKGMITFREDSNIKGVILNQVSEAYYERIASVIEKECDVKVLGYVKNMPDAMVNSRHLGLVSPEEIEDFQSRILALSEVIEETVDIDRLLEIASQSTHPRDVRTVPLAPRDVRTVPVAPLRAAPVDIAVARDEAFSFYYKENLELLEALGAKLHYFSPIHNEKLPEGIDGILLGGGYPEVYTKELSENNSMLSSIKQAYDRQIPILAECGGFLYLQKSIEDENGIEYPLTGILSGKGIKSSGLKRFGYLEVTLENDGLFGKKGTKIKGHEFHHWDCDKNGSDGIARKPLSKISYSCMVHEPYLLAGFPHFYYRNNVDGILHVLEVMKNQKEKRQDE